MTFAFSHHFSGVCLHLLAPYTSGLDFLNLIALICVPNLHMTSAIYSLAVQLIIYHLAIIGSCFSWLILFLSCTLRLYAVANAVGML